MRTRIFHTRFWSDEYILSLSVKEKLLFAYFLTNEHVSIAGVYEIPDQYIRLATGLSLVAIGKIKLRFMQDGKFIFFNSWVRIVNADKYQDYTGEKNDTAREQIIKDAPRELFEKIDRASMDYRYPIDSTRNKKSEIKNKKSKRGESERGSVTVLQKPEIIQQLKVKFPKVNIMLELEKLVDYLQAKGKTQKDYVAFARNWMRNSEQFSKSRTAIIRENVLCSKCGKTFLEKDFYKHSCMTSPSSFSKELVKKFSA
jgi:hypothetical protein